LPTSVTLSTAKGLARQAARCFAALSMTLLDLPAALWLASPCGRPRKGGPP